MKFQTLQKVLIQVTVLKCDKATWSLTDNIDQTRCPLEDLSTKMLIAKKEASLWAVNSSKSRKLLKQKEMGLFLNYLLTKEVSSTLIMSSIRKITMRLKEEMRKLIRSMRQSNRTTSSNGRKLFLTNQALLILEHQSFLASNPRT